MGRLEDLVELRGQLSTWLVEAPVDRKAALVAQYRATITEIDELVPKEAVGDGIDEIAQRRSARRSGPAKASGRAKRSS